MKWITSTDERIPVGKARLYNWYRENRYPELVIKMAGKILFNIELWDKMIDDQIADNIRRSKRERSEEDQKAFEIWKKNNEM